MRSSDPVASRVPSEENATARIAARCFFKRAIWIAGGKDLSTFAYALLAHCHSRHSGGLTVTLWPTRAEAEERKGMIDNVGCGGGCYRHHEIVFIRDWPEDDE